MVFAILLIIIGITTLVFKITGLWDLKKELDQKKENIQEIPQEEVKEEVKQVAITDDDMLAAVLVASIDYRQKIKKDVRLVSVKEVK
jgi:thioredoxin-related protein